MINIYKWEGGGRGREGQNDEFYSPLNNQRRKNSRQKYLSNKSEQCRAFKWITEINITSYYSYLPPFSHTVTYTTVISSSVSLYHHCSFCWKYWFYAKNHQQKWKTISYLLPANWYPYLPCNLPENYIQMIKKIINMITSECYRKTLAE